MHIKKNYWRHLKKKEKQSQSEKTKFSIKKENSILKNR